MVINGKIVREAVYNDLKNKLNDISGDITLAVIQVGNDASSTVYIRQKEIMCNNLGYKFKKFWFEEDTLEEDIISLINRLNSDKMITGILVQLPLPKHINYINVINSIDYKKDVDGLTDYNLGKVFHKEECLVSCTPLGIMKMFDYYNIDLSGKNVVIVGRSDLVGKPLLGLLLNKDASVSICHSKTINLEDYTKQADILIVAVGKKNFINASMIKDGAIVIDVGINKEDGSIYGDVDFDSVMPKCSFITPVPGGVGVMTVTMLGVNLYNAYMLQRGEIL